MFVFSSYLLLTALYRHFCWIHSTARFCFDLFFTPRHSSHLCPFVPSQEAVWMNSDWRALVSWTGSWTQMRMKHPATVAMFLVSNPTYLVRRCPYPCREVSTSTSMLPANLEAALPVAVRPTWVARSASGPTAVEDSSPGLQGSKGHTSKAPPLAKWSTSQYSSVGQTTDRSL